MKTVLVPVDFSATSANTLAYVANFCQDAPVGRVILLKTCYVSIYAELLPSADYVQVNGDEMRQHRQQLERQVNELASELQQQVAPGVKVQVAISKMPLLRSINTMIEQEHPDLIIIGSDGKSYVDESYIGEQVISIARTSSVSVLVVPADYSYEPVERVLLACNYKTILKTHTLSALESRYNWLQPELLVLNVDPAPEHPANQQERRVVEAHLQEILNNYQYRVHYVNDRDILRGITRFADENGVQMIIALPGRHSFLYSLTHKSITAGLSANAKQPVLILK